MLDQQASSVPGLQIACTHLRAVNYVPLPALAIPDITRSEPSIQHALLSGKVITNVPRHDAFILDEDLSLRSLPGNLLALAIQYSATPVRL